MRFGSITRQRNLLGIEAGLVCGLALHANVDFAGRVVTDQYDSEAGDHARLHREFRGTVRNLSADRLAELMAANGLGFRFRAHRAKSTARVSRITTTLI